MKRIVMGFMGAIASGKTTQSQNVRKYAGPLNAYDDLGYIAGAPGTAIGDVAVPGSYNSLC